MLGFELLLDKLVLLGELFGFLDHAVNIGFAETALIIGDSDGLDLSSSLLGGLDGKDGVLVDLESDLNLGGSTGSGWDAVDIKLTELMVILNKSAFTFENSNGNSSLLVLVSGESLRLFGGDDGSSVDDLGQDTSNSLNTKREGSNINEEDIFGFISGLTTQNTSLNGGTISNSLVGVNTAVRFLTIEEVFHELLDLGDTGRSTNKDDLVDLRFLHACVIKYLLDGGDGLLEEISTEFLETGTGKSFLKVDSVNKSLNGDFNLDNSREVTLGLLNFSLKLL